MVEIICNINSIKNEIGSMNELLMMDKTIKNHSKSSEKKRASAINFKGLNGKTE